MKKTAKERYRDEWVRETQMFQRISGIEESSREDLEQDYCDVVELAKSRRDVKNSMRHR